MLKIESQIERVKASKKIVNDWRYSRIKLLINNLNEIHPEKVKKVLELVDEKQKIIIFSQYRNTVAELVDVINSHSASRAKAFVGQRGGLTQKKQIKILEEYKANKFNVLVATSVSEEGIHIDNADVGIFYEPVPSALRTIQRRGRIGRINVGKIYLLITKNTIDEKYYWVSYHKERKMRDMLKNENNN
jgi:Fanconi anemia group M protein